jgi:RIO-like serine/threonine protein kinase
LRKNSTRLRQQEFKQHVQTLRDAKLIDYNLAAGTYYLTPDGWKA